MTVFLLDINVLVPLLDNRHAFSQHAHRWFAESIGPADGWATCAITENGFLRVATNARFTGDSNIGFRELLAALEISCRDYRHSFWPMDISIREFLRSDIILAPKQITDIYLLGLAIEHGGKFATFDGKIPAHLLPGGIDALEAISGPDDPVS